MCSDIVDLTTLEDKLQVVESSSPSYPLMATLDINADIMLTKGKELMSGWADNIRWFYEAAKEIDGLVLMNTPELDPTKLNIDMSAYSYDGNQLEEYLMEKGIFIELVAGNLVMCMTGIGNKRIDFERLIDALKELAENNQKVEVSKAEQPLALTKKLQWKGVPLKKEMISVDEAAGRVCAMSVIPYPPGIPIACPGEILDKEILEYVKERKLAKEKVRGMSGDFMICVGKE